MEQLFMLEVLVDKIIFASTPIPQKKQLVVQATCGNIVQLEIRTDVMGALETQERDSKRMDVDVNCGKSYVFPMIPKKLKEVLKNSPMQIFVSTKLDTDPIGMVIIPWEIQFSEMIDAAEDGFGYVTPVCIRNYFQLMKNDKPAGGIELYIRLSALGKFIDTHIQVIDAVKSADAPVGNKQYLFKDINNATTFQCKKYGMGSDTDVIPVAPIYAATDRTNPTESTSKVVPDFLNLYQTSGSASMQSVAPSVFGMSVMMMMPGAFGGLSRLSLQSAISEIGRTVRTRSTNRLFMDIRELLGESNFSAFFGHMDLQDSNGGVIEMIDYKSLTVEQIERMLCKNPDCPAAKKFKDFGIGPLANGNGLGGLYKNVEAPVTYGLSHCNGRTDRYGPLGTFSHSKHPEDPFIRKRYSEEIANEMYSYSSGSGNSECDDSCEKPPKRLSAGSDIFELVHEPKVTKKRGRKLNRLNKYYDKLSAPLRLRGGSPISIPANETFPNPQSECKDLMEEYNKLLTEYKNALGPCGQATCPFAQNLVAETCKRVCHQVPTSDEETKVDVATPVEALGDAQEAATNLEDISGCGIGTCPFNRDIITPADKDHKKLQTKPACGSPQCPFLREKLGMEDIDDCHMPPLPCAGKKCTFNTGGELPPIHWDCPDPLPQGECKNPCCPFVNREKIVKKYFPPPSSPCGSPTCPFTTIPCTFPGCPFAEIEACPPSCPYLEPVPSDLLCSPSICPFAPRETDICDNPNCPHQKQEPTCTLNEKPEKKKNPCPYAKKRKSEGPCAPKPKICGDSDSGSSTANMPVCLKPPKRPCRAPPLCCWPPPTCDYDPPEPPSCVRIPDPCCGQPPPPLPCCGRPPPPPDPCCGKPPPPCSDPCKLPPCRKPEPKSKSCKDYSSGSRVDGENESDSSKSQSCMNDPIRDCIYKRKTSSQNRRRSTDDIQRDETFPSICMEDCIYNRNRGDGKQNNKRKSSRVSGDGFDESSMSNATPCGIKTCAVHGGELVCNECEKDERNERKRSSNLDRKALEKKSLEATDKEKSRSQDMSEKRLSIKKTKKAGGKKGKPNKQAAAQAIAPSSEGKKLSKKKKRKRKARTGYVYDEGTYYPGTKIGHRECVVPKFMVPPDMGWLWNIHTKCMNLRPRRGWKPGAIGRTIATRINEHRKKYGLEPLEISDPKNKKMKGLHGKGYNSEDEDLKIPLRPTLQVKKKDGIVYVTMNPLKDPKFLDSNEDPYMNCSPMQFKIMKNKPPPKKRDFKMCYCGDFGDGDGGEEDEIPSTSSSELDIEFTPPAGIIRPERLRRKKNVCHIDTQYEIEDCGIKPIPAAAKPSKTKSGKGKGKGKKK